MTLVVYLIAIAGIVVGTLLAVGAHDARIRAEVEAAWKPRLEACQSNEKTAIEANATLKADLKTLSDKTASNNEQIAKLAERSDRAIADSADLVALYKAKAVKDETSLAALRASLRVSLPKGASCQVRLDAVTSAINTAVASRLSWVLGIGPAPAAPAVSPPSPSMRVR